MSDKKLIQAFRNAVETSKEQQSSKHKNKMLRTAAKFQRRLEKRAGDVEYFKWMDGAEELIKKVWNVEPSEFSELRDTVMQALEEAGNKIEEAVAANPNINIMSHDTESPEAPDTEPAPEMMREMIDEEIPGPPRMPTFSSVSRKFENILKNSNK